jgi:hypothetical protein
VTRSMKFRIRVGPAQTLQHCFFSAKYGYFSGLFTIRLIRDYLELEVTRGTKERMNAW